MGFDEDNAWTSVCTVSTIIMDVLMGVHLR